MTAKPQPVIHHVITRVYHENEIPNLPEHIKANLKKVISVCNVEKITWPKPKDRLIEIVDGGQRVLAYYHPIGMQNDAFLYCFKEHSGAFARNHYAYVDPNADAFDFKIGAKCFLPLDVLAEGLAATLYDPYIHEIDGSDVIANSDVGWLHLSAELTEAAKYIRRRKVLPVVMTGWNNRNYGCEMTNKLRSVRLADGSPYNRRDISALLKEYDHDIIHPMGFVKATNVCWNDERQCVEVMVGGLHVWKWVPVVGVENQTEELAYEIEHTGYVRWDISDLAPQQTEENRNHVDETDSKEQGL